MKQSKILLVDDSPDNIYLLEMMLQAKNYRTLSAQNGREAIQMVKSSGDVDLILIDVMMPEMDGFEASRNIRNMVESAHIPIIMMTAKKRELMDVVRGLDEGALDYLTKPFEEEELMARVKSMLRVKHLHDDNRILLEKLQKQQKMLEQELKVAEKVQYAMLPLDADCPAKCKVDAYYRATASVGGDYYDFLRYDDDRTAFMIADVSGHGPSAALIVAMLKTLLLNEKWDFPSPAKMLARLNEKLLPMIPEDHYLTAFYCIVDTAKNTIVFSRAGHPTPFLFGGGKEDVMPLDDGHGSIVGMFENAEFGEATVSFSKGDKLFMYSDGIFEVPDSNGEMYGLRALKEMVCANRDKSGKEMIETIIKDVDAYWNGESQRDDVAVLVLEFN